MLKGLLFVPPVPRYLCIAPISSHNLIPVVDVSPQVLLHKISLACPVIGWGIMVEYDRF